MTTPRGKKVLYMLQTILKFIHHLIFSFFFSFFPSLPRGTQLQPTRPVPHSHGISVLSLERLVLHRSLRKVPEFGGVGLHTKKDEATDKNTAFIGDN